MIQKSNSAVRTLKTHQEMVEGGVSKMGKENILGYCLHKDKNI